MGGETCIGDQNGSHEIMNICAILECDHGFCENHFNKFDCRTNGSKRFCCFCNNSFMISILKCFLKND